MKENKPLKILIVVESIDVEDSSGSKANVALIQNLKKAGFILKVYHYSRKEIEINGVETFSIKERRRNLIFLLSRIERYIRKFLNINLNRYIESFFGFSFTLFNDRNSIICELKNLKNYSPQLVITLSKGGSFRPHHALLKIPELHSRWLAYIHDPYPMHFYPSPYTWREPGHSQKEKFMREMFEKAAYIGFPSKILKEWMSNFIIYKNEKSVVIPHQISRNEIQEIKTPDYFNEKKFILLHAGYLLKGRNPLGLIEAFRRFINENPAVKNDVHLIFLGNKSHYSKDFLQLKSSIPQLYVSEAYVQHSEVLSMQKCASLNIILETKSNLSPFLPGKFPHCIMANKPILLLGPSKSESRRLLGKNYSYWSEIDDIEKIKNLISDIYLKWVKNESLELNRPDLQEYLSEVALKETIDSVLEN